jgi:hypothetical protein
MEVADCISSFSFEPVTLSHLLRYEPNTYYIIAFHTKNSIFRILSVKNFYLAPALHSTLMLVRWQDRALLSYCTPFFILTCDVCWQRTLKHHGQVCTGDGEVAKQLAGCHQSRPTSYVHIHDKAGIQSLVMYSQKDVALHHLTDQRTNIS